MVIASGENSGSKPSAVLAVLHDNDALFSEMEAALGTEGFDSRPFHSATNLQEWLKENTPEVILVHLGSVKKSGETISLIREQCPLVPLLALGNASHSEQIGQALRNGANHFVLDSDDSSVLANTVDRLIHSKMEHLRYIQVLPYLHTKFEAELPSDLDLLNGTVFYLTEEMYKFGIISPAEINVKVSLIEALTNAMEHGNDLDKNKKVKIFADFSHEQAVIEIIDEGEGFEVNRLPNPTMQENIFKTRGRGVFMMRQFLDGVEYFPPGNHVKLTKKRASESAFHKQFTMERRTV